MKRVIYPTEDGGAIHEYTKKKEFKADPAPHFEEEDFIDDDDETVITVRLGSNVDFVRIESICISRKEKD